MISWVISSLNMWIFYILSFFTIFFGCWTIISKNPISSVVNLVATFVSCACIFILLEINLLGLIYIIVYVGAIAILFIFVIMMMDLRNITDQIKLSTSIKNENNNNTGYRANDYRFYYPLTFIILILIGITTIIYLQKYFLISSIFYQDYFSIWEIAQKNIWDSLLISLNLIHSIGYILYTDFLSLLLLVSLILLMIMIGVIVLIKNNMDM